MLTLEIRRPWGGPVVADGVDGTLSTALEGQTRPANPGGLYYTHVATVPLAADVRDGCTRVAGTSQLVFAMGDEVRIPAGSAYGARYAVVLVERLTSAKRVYLCRDDVQWGTDNAP